MADNGSNENQRLQFRLEYWHKRLDQTLQHTQAATRLTYLADGAVLGFCYFWVKALGKNGLAFGTAAIAVLLLAVMNLFHAALIRNQQSWFNGIDERLRELLEVEQVKHAPVKCCCLFPRSSHRAWLGIHLAISAALLMLGVLFCFRGCSQRTSKDAQPKAGAAIASSKQTASGEWKDGQEVEFTGTVSPSKLTRYCLAAEGKGRVHIKSTEIEKLVLEPGTKLWIKGEIEVVRHEKPKEHHGKAVRKTEEGEAVGVTQALSFPITACYVRVAEYGVVKPGEPPQRTQVAP